MADNPLKMSFVIETTASGPGMEPASKGYASDDMDRLIVSMEKLTAAIGGYSPPVKHAGEQPLAPAASQEVLIPREGRSSSTAGLPAPLPGADPALAGLHGQKMPGRAQAQPSFTQGTVQTRPTIPPTEGARQPERQTGNVSDRPAESLAGWTELAGTAGKMALDVLETMGMATAEFAAAVDEFGFVIASMDGMHTSSSGEKLVDRPDQGYQKGASPGHEMERPSQKDRGMASPDREEARQEPKKTQLQLPAARTSLAPFSQAPAAGAVSQTQLQKPAGFAGPVQPTKIAPTGSVLPISPSGRGHQIPPASFPAGQTGPIPPKGQLFGSSMVPRTGPGPSLGNVSAPTERGRPLPGPGYRQTYSPGMTVQGQGGFTPPDLKPKEPRYVQNMLSPGASQSRTGSFLKAAAPYLGGGTTSRVMQTFGSYMAGDKDEFGKPKVTAIHTISAAAEAIEKVARVSSNLVSMTGKIDSAMIRGDVWGKAEASIQRTAYALEKIPVLGGAISGVYELTQASYRASVARMQATEERGRELAGYSPDLATAVAMSDVKKLLFDIEEAQTLGPEYASMIEAKRRFEIEQMRYDLPRKRKQFEDDLANLRRMEHWERKYREGNWLEDARTWAQRTASRLAFWEDDNEMRLDHFRSSSLFRMIHDQVQAQQEAQAANTVMSEMYNMLRGNQRQHQPPPEPPREDVQFNLLRALQGL